MGTRRSFIKSTAWGTTALSLSPLTSFASSPFNNLSSMATPKISLAQWSLHRAFEGGKINAIDFANISKNTYGIDAVEYVNSLYEGQGSNEKFWSQMKERADKEGVKNLLIMVDDEGFLGNPNDQDRITAVENHFKWVNAAKIMGCHSIRVNAFGEGSKAAIRTALVDGMGRLASYAAKEDINVLIENHGLHTSDAAFIVDIIKEVNSSNLGTLPDFGNWCLNAEWGSTANNKCTDVYDRYQGVAELLPYAKGVSAKSYNFNDKGEETIIDYRKLLQMVKDDEFKGYIGIEYEGEDLSEPEGIFATKALIENVWNTLD